MVTYSFIKTGPRGGHVHAWHQRFFCSAQSSCSSSWKRFQARLKSVSASIAGKEGKGIKAKALAIFTILALCLSLLAVVAPPKASSVLAATLIPHAFYGDVTIGSEAAQVGTVVSAMVNGVKSGSVTTWQEGRYGWGLGAPEEGKDNLLVQGEHISSGDEIDFYINGVKADQTSTFQSWVWTELDLTVASPTTPGQVEYWALVVGISDYPGTVNDLPYAAKDAQDVRSALLTAEIWSSGHIIMLTDDDATASAIEDAISALGSITDDNDLFFFFFSGHGGNKYDAPPLDEVDGLDEYLCPYDFSPNRIVDDELGQWLGDLPMTKVAVAIDSCFSGGMIRGESDEVLVRTVAYEGTPQVGDGFVKDLDDVLQGVVLTASAEDEYSIEHGLLANGIFTNYFMAGLREGAADANGNAQISMEEAYDYLYQPVVDFSWVVSLGQYTMHPQMFDNYPGELKLMGPRMPDLAISAVDPDPLYTSMGVEIELGVTIENIGDGDAADFGFLVDVYEDLDTAPEATERGENRQYMDYLGSSESETLWFTVSYDDVGEYQLWAQVNTGHWLAESNEDNNVYGPVPVTVFTPELNPHFRADKTLVEIGEWLTFENLTIGGTHPYTWAEWDFNADGIIDQTRTGTEAPVMADVTWAYDTPGVYTVRLWMTDSTPTTMYEERILYIEVGLPFIQPEISLDVKGAVQRFEIHNLINPNRVVEWELAPGINLLPEDIAIYAGGEPGDIFIEIMAARPGDIHVIAWLDQNLSLDSDGDGNTNNDKDLPLPAEKKWGVIEETELDMDPLTAGIQTSIVSDAGDQETPDVEVFRDIIYAWFYWGEEEIAVYPAGHAVVHWWLFDKDKLTTATLLDDLQVLVGCSTYDPAPADTPFDDIQDIYTSGLGMEADVTYFTKADGAGNTQAAKTINGPDQNPLVADAWPADPNVDASFYDFTGTPTYVKTMTIDDSVATTLNPRGTVDVEATNIGGEDVVVITYVEYPIDYHGENVVCVEYGEKTYACCPPFIYFSPESFSFSATEDGATPEDQILEVSMINLPDGQHWEVSSDADWLGLSPPLGITTDNQFYVTLYVDISGMSAGEYSATVTITVEEADNSQQTVPVSLTIYPPTQLTTAWRFHAPGFFPQHLPDSYTRQVVLAGLNAATIPDEVQGVWWYDPTILAYRFWVPGVGGELTTLTGQFYNYMVLVTGACVWEIPFP